MALLNQYSGYCHKQTTLHFMYQLQFTDHDFLLTKRILPTMAYLYFLLSDKIVGTSGTKRNMDAAHGDLYTEQDGTGLHLIWMICDFIVVTSIPFQAIG